jgi:hypothetical protein
MRSEERPLPNDDDVRRLLSTAFCVTDRRAAASTLFLLAHSLSARETAAIRWSDIYIRQGQAYIRSKAGEPCRKLNLTPFLMAQLRLVPVVSASSPVFMKPKDSSLTLSGLFSAMLLHVGLDRFSWSNFRLWSLAQSPSTRLDIATRAWD